MKRQAINCLKMKRLANVLNIPMNHARGIMEHLWAFAAENRPRGDIGRDMTDKDIQMEIAPELVDVNLVKALCDCQWIDKAEKPIRLYIHDWHAHADDAVRKKLERNGMNFANGCKPRCYSSLHNSECLDGISTHSRRRIEDVALMTRRRRDSGSLPVPVPEPVPEPVPVSPPNPQGGIVCEGWVHEFREALLGTGKVETIAVEAIVMLDRAHPKARLCEKWHDVVTEVASMSGGCLRNPVAWVRKCARDIEARALGYGPGQKQRVDGEERCVLEGQTWEIPLEGKGKS